ncbi:MAG TPA: ATP-binding protein [Terracidiphilus sp.]|jgi:two-component system nitrogen regulation sensor histidine kinase NtrY|nr:ATP-binding protein [Terracidiphilus sp.]
MSFLGDARRRTVVLLGAGVLLFFALLGGLQAFNTSNVRFLNPETAGETLAFTGLTVVVFLLLIVLLLLLLRNILKLYADQASSALGAQLRTRMVLGAVLIALAPAAFMFLFSFQLMNRSIDRWFSPNTTELREDSTRVVLELAQYVTSNARGEAESIAATGAPDGDPAALQNVLGSHRITLQGGFALVYGKDRHVAASYQAPPENSAASLIPWLPERSDAGTREAIIQLHGPLSANLLTSAQRDDEPVIRIGGADYALGMSVTASGKIVLAALPMPQGLSQTTSRIREGAAAYWDLFRSRNRIRSTFFLMLLLITVVIFFSSMWLALFLSKQITRPVEALGDAMNKIAAGRYDHRVGLVTTGEMADLVRSFNHMAADLEASRQLAESSSAQVIAANQAIEERRRELETIVETIPSGVVTLDSAGLVLQANRAFAALMGQPDEPELRGKKLDSLLPSECVDDFASVIRRGQRMGAASTELNFHARGRLMHLAVTSARLELAREKTGTVLVIEDMTELLRAQRQLAWKEVAQRVAHEIKNPLTPIALSAERIGRHLDRSQPDSPSVIRKCSEVILGCVSTLRTLVDQFSALAQFPTPQPRACDMNLVLDEALALFADRLDGITVRRELEPHLPMVLADPEAIRRALANLIDNAAEAMQGSLLRVLDISSGLSEDSSAVEIAIADTGHGLTDEIRERLFLPFYSTKHRGTGLGLSIAAKIVQEHGGSIRAESNAPKGARFLLRLPLMEVGQPPASEAPAAESLTKAHS